MTDEDSEEEENGEEVKKIIVEHKFRKISSDGTAEDFSPPRVIEGEDDKTTEEKLAEREAQLQLLAQKAFEDEKEKILSQIPEEKREKAEAFIGDDPNKLEFLKYQLDLSEEDLGTEPVPPKGKVKGLVRKPQSGSKTENPIESLYEIRKREAITPTELREQAIADAKITELFNQLGQGLVDRPKDNPYRFTVAECAHCHTVLYGKHAENYARNGTCSQCGYTPPKGGH